MVWNACKIYGVSEMSKGAQVLIFCGWSWDLGGIKTADAVFVTWSVDIRIIFSSHILKSGQSGSELKALGNKQL
jgi:hypothetical protein